MRTFFLLVLIAGVAAGFGYPWAVTNFSGRELGTWPVYERGSGFRPVTTRLTEADAPVRVLVDLTSLGPVEFAPRSTVLTVTASTGGRTVLADTLTFAEAKPQERSPQMRDRIYRDEGGVITDIEDGDYIFVIGPGDADGIEMSAVDLVLRASAVSVDRRVPPIGYAAAAIGFIGLVLSLRRRRRDRAASTEALPPRWGRSGDGRDGGAR
ncbi:hypothetical protein ABMA32_16865 [Mesorhizobium sp. VNQ89]|uniref:hypothetical protein n=1 Tax=Mesorhizobium quangtriensis TaxID=3157709 RepID=UPI0032B74744